MSVSAAREAVLLQTTDLLLTARRTHTPIVDLPAELTPASEQEAFAVQDQIAQAYGPIGGWKIGAAGPEGLPFFAPMPAGWMGEDGALFRGLNHRLLGVEAEIAFHMRQDLAPSATPYTRDEVVAAIGSCHPAIEVLESAFVDPQAVARTNMLADMQMHGGFVAGPPVPQWHEIDWANELVTLTVDGAVRYEAVGTAPAGPDLVRLLVYLANEGAARTGGLKRGDWITTGSWSGLTWASPGAEVVAHFKHAGKATVLFASEKL